MGPGHWLVLMLSVPLQYFDTDSWEDIVHTKTTPLILGGFLEEQDRL